MLSKTTLTSWVDDDGVRWSQRINKKDGKVAGTKFKVLDPHFKHENVMTPKSLDLAIAVWCTGTLGGIVYLVYAFITEVVT